MAAVSIRNLDDEVKALLRRRAAGHGTSMEQEMRRILTESVKPAPRTGLIEALRDAGLAVGGVELELPTRDTAPASLDVAPEHLS